MQTIYLLPNWFHGIDATLEIIFAVITFLVALFSFKIYRITGEKEHRNFGIGFLTISFAYVLWAYLNHFIVSELSESVSVLNLKEIMVVSSILIYSFIVLYTSGFFIIYNSTLNQKILENAVLMFSIISMSIYLSSDKTMIFAFFSTIFPLFISLHYFRTYLTNRKFSTFLLALAFCLISISGILFTFATNNYIYYIAKHVLELISYSLIAGILMLTLKHGKKKK